MGAPKPPGPPGGMGPAGAPGAMAGNQAAAMSKVQAGLKALMEALPQLPIGSELSNSVMDAVSKIGKHLPEHGMGGDGGNLIQQLALMAREAKAQPNPMMAMGGGAPLPAGAGAGGPPPAMGV